MIEFKNISFTYDGSKIPALADINATLQPGLFLLAGENGAGKTTLLHVICGLAHPQQGECIVYGAEADSTLPTDMKNVFLLEENQYFPGKTIRNFANLHSRFYPNFSEKLFINNLQAFGLNGYEPLRTLSLGNRKKAQLAYVLALGVKVLLLDEPTNALDIEGRDIFRKLLVNTMASDQTVIVSTHNVPDLEKLFDGAIILQGSKLLFAGTEEQVAQRLALETSIQADPDALYSENQAGKFLNIYPAEKGQETRVDWRALYLALHYANSNEIYDYLSQKPSMD